MKYMLGFLAGLIIIAAAAITVHLSARAFDASRDFEVAAVIFQNADLSEDRMPKPIPLADMNPDIVRNTLIKKFVYEYFYVVPDIQNVEARRGAGSVLSRMASAAIFKDWVENVSPDISTLAGNKVLRRVRVHDDINQSGDYFYLTYDLLEFNQPNNLLAKPKITSNQTIGLKINFENGIWESYSNGNAFNARKELENGADPATMFRFKVSEVVLR